ncbi:hypothetical protein GCM10009789_85000 [Kribbella sancticallisti]|uniref:Beta-lactamase-related domain-containing protein n=1 Tax=Kribbella sancticallisti TaxID=460087 RepID=A0ABN2EUQ5_9ACTN
MLNRLNDAVRSHVDRGELAGAITLVSHAGKPHIETFGNLAFPGNTGSGSHGALSTAGDEDSSGAQRLGDGGVMRRDSLFRVASFTKPIVAAATMMLVDSGRLFLDDPIGELLPELAEPRVLRQPDGPLDDTVPAARPITVHDLLTFRMGLGETDHPEIRQREEELELRTFGPPKPRSPLEPDGWIQRLGTLPLQYQPGERWQYSTGSHLLGVLIARAAGMPLEDFLRERLFEPLGMIDTGFTATDPDRLTTAYLDDEVFDTATESQWSEPPSFPDGSGGLISTVDDFHAFTQMLLAEATESSHPKRCGS